MLRLIPTVLFLYSIAHAQSVEIIKSQNIKTTERINNHRYGGISGLSYSDGFLWGISDDRGQYGKPRIYKHSLRDNTVKIEEEISVNEPTGFAVVDFEAVSRFKDGTFLISSEGDLNKKPRVFPFVKFWSPTNLGTANSSVNPTNKQTANWFDEIVLPDDFYPEKTGMQTKGLQNNSAFEAVTVTPDEKTIYLMSEVPLYQNQNSEIEFLEYEKIVQPVAKVEQVKPVEKPELSKVRSKLSKHEENKSSWTLKSRRTYLRNLAPEGTFEVMRGVSEILYWKPDSILVLERWVRLNKSKAIVIGAELFSVNLKDLKKKKLFTFDGDLAANWEGLSWGPDLSDGRKLLILVSDNNFERSTPTQFLFMAFNEKAELKP